MKYGSNQHNHHGGPGQSEPVPGTPPIFCEVRGPAKARRWYAGVHSREPYTLFAENHHFCLELLADIEFELVYVGSAESGPKYDQILETVSIGPIVEGTFQFILEVCLHFVTQALFCGVAPDYISGVVGAG